MQLKHLFHLLCTVFLICIATPNSAEALEGPNGITWHKDYQSALQASKNLQVPVFALFTGSDWCPWCIRLEDEVLNTQDFADEMKSKMVFFIADFPRKNRPTKTIASQNRRLKEKFRVKGFPTVLLLSSEEEVMGKTGYRKGGPIEYAEYLQSELEEFMEKTTPVALAE